jgi:hypothetical protein
MRSHEVAPAFAGCMRGDIRVLYEVDDEAATVYIINIGIIS